MKPSKCLAKEKGKQIGKKRERRGERGENTKESKYKTLSQNFASCTRKATKYSVIYKWCLIVRFGSFEPDSDQKTNSKEQMG